MFFNLTVHHFSNVSRYVYFVTLLQHERNLPPRGGFLFTVLCPLINLGLPLSGFLNFSHCVQISLVVNAKGCVLKWVLFISPSGLKLQCAIDTITRSRRAMLTKRWVIQTNLAWPAIFFGKDQFRPKSSTTSSVHGSKRGLRVESPMAGDELTCWAGTKNQTFKVKYCESDIV